MRYVVTFFDRTTRRVNPEAAQQFMAAMHDGGNVLYRGQMFSGKTVASVRTIFGFYQDRKDHAERDGKYFCKYGHEHEFRLDCACKDARFEKLFTPEELTLLPTWDDDKEREQAALLSNPSKRLS